MSLFSAAGDTSRACAFVPNSASNCVVFRTAGLRAVPVIVPLGMRACGRPNTQLAGRAALSNFAHCDRAACRVRHLQRESRAGHGGNNFRSGRRGLLDEPCDVADRHRLAQVHDAGHGRRAVVYRNCDGRVAADAIAAVDRAQERVGAQVRVQIPALDLFEMPPNTSVPARLVSNSRSDVDIAPQHCLRCQSTQRTPR